MPEARSSRAPQARNKPLRPSRTLCVLRVKLFLSLIPRSPTIPPIPDSYSSCPAFRNSGQASDRQQAVRLDLAQDEERPDLPHAGQGEDPLGVEAVEGGKVADADLEEIVHVAG